MREDIIELMQWYVDNFAEFSLRNEKVIEVHTNNESFAVYLERKTAFGNVRLSVSYAQMFVALFKEINK